MQAVSANAAPRAAHKRAPAGRRSVLGARLPQRQIQACAAGSGPSTTAKEYPALQPLDDTYKAAHAFSSYANWLLPGRVLLGRYPYVEPSRCPSREQGEQQLSEILGAGITTFISLQEEVPAQQDMRAAGVGGFLPYKATAELIHATLIGPPPEEVMSKLRNPTLDQFLPPRKKTTSPTYASYAAHQLELRFLRCPIQDLEVPSSDALLALVHDLELRVAAGECLYLHCWGGRGRAGTVGAALLASMYGLGPEEALARVQRAFDTRGDKPGQASPETDEQRAFVAEFIAQRLAL